MQPLSAFEPAPADGMLWVNPADVLLEWNDGMGAFFHDVYLSTDPQAVTDRDSGALRQRVALQTQLRVGALEPDTTYYWAVDEIQADTTTTAGTLWRFTTVGDVAGIEGAYFSNKDLSGEPALTRMDPAINFDWGQNAPAPDVPAGEFSVRWTGELQVPWTDTYHFVARASDGVRLWIDGQLIINDWVDRSVSRSSGEIGLTAGRKHSFVLEYYQGFNNAIIELMWENSLLPEQLVPAGALQPLSTAGLHRPLQGSTNVSQEPILQWIPMPQAQQHDLYLGTDANAVAAATTASAGIYQGRLDQDQTRFTPQRLDWNATYYWRVDEVGAGNGNSPVGGQVWRFTTANGIVIDGFESYSMLAGEEVFLSWLDGFGGDETLGGSTVGHLLAPYVETKASKVRSGAQSLPFYYVNDGNFNDFNERPGTAAFSLILHTFADAQNFQRRDNRDLDRLVLALTGSRTNGVDDLTVTLTDAANQSGTVNHPDNPQAVQSTVWSEWFIDLSVFQDQGVDVTRIQSLTLGIGNRNQTVGNKGVIWVDDIRLIPPVGP